MQYYINLNGQTIGPMNEHQVMAYSVNQNTPISKEGGDWQPLYTYPELMQLLQQKSNFSGGASEVNNKKVLCGILAILVGTLGVQYFVLGKTAGGIITILLSIVSCGLWGVVTLIQGILMLCMSDEEFERKYINSTSTLPLF
ncbi:MAG: DUF4339 domain-containing protein [Bacteroidales bacterium]|nr:DUF4339 domain-containing protein [Bacteroidales bacterium]MDE6237138.1 GYF domain-containing protein [Muribaculaceae bacterium]MDE6835859.1 GYF domain-containing protein [Muribaculaceae bacterium]MDE6866545.1 GYF domain-containing protein [Muribaculaceae bacterium]